MRSAHTLGYQLLAIHYQLILIGLQIIAAQVYPYLRALVRNGDGGNAVTELGAHAAAQVQSEAACAHIVAAVAAGVALFENARQIVDGSRPSLRAISRMPRPSFKKLCRLLRSSCVKCV